MKKLHFVEYVLCLIGLLVLNGILTADRQTTATIIIAVVLGLYCTATATLAIARGIRR